MNETHKKAKVVEKYRIMCPHCLKLKDASAWAMAHYNIEILFTCSDCGMVFVIEDPDFIKNRKQ